MDFLEIILDILDSIMWINWSWDKSSATKVSKPKIKMKETNNKDYVMGMLMTFISCNYSDDELISDEEKKLIKDLFLRYQNELSQSQMELLEKLLNHPFDIQQLYAYYKILNLTDNQIISISVQIEKVLFDHHLDGYAKNSFLRQLRNEHVKSL